MVFPPVWGFGVSHNYQLLRSFGTRDTKKVHDATGLTVTVTAVRARWRVRGFPNPERRCKC
jgi:hypothetical protein